MAVNRATTPVPSGEPDAVGSLSINELEEGIVVQTLLLRKPHRATALGAAIQTTIAKIVHE